MNINYYNLPLFVHWYAYWLFMHLLTNFLLVCFTFSYWFLRGILCKTLCPLAVISVHFSHSVVSDSLQPHGLQHDRLSCPSPTPGVCSNSCPSSRCCHTIILFSAVPFSTCLQPVPASGSFPMSQFPISGGQNIGVWASASVLPMNIQDWFPLGLTRLIFL